MREMKIKFLYKLLIKLGNWLIKHNIYTLTDDEKYNIKRKVQNDYLKNKKKVSSGDSLA